MENLQVEHSYFFKLEKVHTALRMWMLEAPPGLEPGIKDLQSSALPLGHGALFISTRKNLTSH